MYILRLNLFSRQNTTKHNTTNKTISKKKKQAGELQFTRRRGSKKQKELAYGPHIYIIDIIWINPNRTACFAFRCTFPFHEQNNTKNMFLYENFYTVSWFLIIFSIRILVFHLVYDYDP